MEECEEEERREERGGYQNPLPHPPSLADPGEHPSLVAPGEHPSLAALGVEKGTQKPQNRAYARKQNPICAESRNCYMSKENKGFM